MSRRRRNAPPPSVFVDRLHGLGMTLMISGFIGMPGVVLLNVSRNLPLTLGAHLAVLVICMVACIWKSGSVARWISSTRSGSSYSIHPGWVALIGLFFAGGGFAIVCLVDPNDGPTAQKPNTMTLAEARYFASIFIQLGLGVTAVSLGEVIHRQKRSRIHSRDKRPPKLN